MRNDKELLTKAIEAAISGGIEILDVYKHDFDVEFKDDKSPLTMADRRAHEAISRILNQTGLPVLSEEGKHIPYDLRKGWAKFWMVDPLDGTKEFVKRNGEFTVNIALIIHGKAEMGIIFVPVSGLLYFASELTGARKVPVESTEYFNVEELISSAETLPSQALPGKLTVVCSRSHMSPETHDFVDQLKKDGQEPEFISIGSSLKLCLIAEGKAHIYPRFGPTMEWDTAAGQAIVEKSGGKVLKTDQSGPIEYNKAGLLNPWFIAYFSTSTSSTSNTSVA
jgi:3'(2'), 5'-bisphosphate nucleotidase